MPVRCYGTFRKNIGPHIAHVNMKCTQKIASLPMKIVIPVLLPYVVSTSTTIYSLVFQPNASPSNALEGHPLDVEHAAMVHGGRVM
jgi:hypothetical protein